MSPRRAKIAWRHSRWLAAGAALAVMPKCLLCVVAYLGIAAALGFGGPEICGASASATPLHLTLLLVTLSGVFIGLLGFVASHRRRASDS
jgi:hypothetical protein